MVPDCEERSLLPASPASSPPRATAQRSCLCSSYHPGPLHTRDTVPAPALSRPPVPAAAPPRLGTFTPTGQPCTCRTVSLHSLSQLTFSLQAACSLKPRNVLNSLDPQHPALSWSATNMSVMSHCDSMEKALSSETWHLFCLFDSITLTTQTFGPCFGARLYPLKFIH